MKRYQSGEKVRGGYYWRPANWEIVPVQGAEGCLPGAPGERFLALPLFAIPFVVVLLATFFCMFYLPAAGFIAIGQALRARFSKAESPPPPA